MVVLLQVLGISHPALRTRDLALFRPLRKKLRSRSLISLSSLVYLFMGRRIGLDYENPVRNQIFNAVLSVAGADMSSSLSLLVPLWISFVAVRGCLNRSFLKVDGHAIFRHQGMPSTLANIKWRVIICFPVLQLEFTVRADSNLHYVMDESTCSSWATK